MSFADFCDLSWAHMARPPGGMVNPFEFREMMKAAVGYTDRTVAEVRQEFEAPAKPVRGKRVSTEPKQSVPQQSQLDKLAALAAGGIRKDRPVVG